MNLSQENGHIPFPRMEISHGGKGKEICHLSFPVLVPTFASCTVLSHSPGSRLLSPNGHLHLQRVCWASYPICIPLGCFKVNHILCKGRKPQKNPQVWGEGLLGMPVIRLFGQGWILPAVTQRTALLYRLPVVVRVDTSASPEFLLHFQYPWIEALGTKQ